MSAILQLSTDKKPRPITDVTKCRISDEEGSKGWLHIRLRPGHELHLSPTAVEEIEREIARSK